ncbi:probable cytochrome P450 4ac3 [Thrips palmi]|uniref:Probable cytochrome P450 4ac3 n=1 Tax=Thrips palmi TaxID=161013 RepID=A0A6P8YCV0_THRPL|nr:probable cytochrome P450 4ac3 [Thrips palmi]
MHIFRRVEWMRPVRQSVRFGSPSLHLGNCSVARVSLCASAASRGATSNRHYHTARTMVLVTDVLVLAALGGVATLLALFLQKYWHFRKLELAIPGPPSLPLLGNTMDFVNATPDTVLKTVRRLTGGIGGQHKLSRFSLMNHLVVFVNTAEGVECLVRHPDFKSKAQFAYHLLDNRLSLLQLVGAEWRARRKALELGFNKNVLNSFMETFNEEAKGFVDRVVTGMPVDVTEPLREAISRNFLQTSMSTNMEQEARPYMDFLEQFLRTSNQRAFNPLLWSDRLFYMTPSGKKVLKMKTGVHALISRGLAQKKKEARCRDSEHRDRARRVLADILLDLHDRGDISEDVVIDEVKTFFSATVETTVSTLSSALKVLSMYPEVQERVFSEVDAVLGDRDVTTEDLPRMKYLDCVVKEVLRMFPALPLVGRQSPRETELCGHVIPAYSTVILNLQGVHFDPRHWRDPHVFDPDRFLPENSQGRHRCAFVPFSIGSRNCIGGKYAMMVATTFLAVVVRAYRVLPVRDHEDIQSLLDNLAFDLASRLVGGTRVVFQPRGRGSGFAAASHSSQEYKL